MGIPKPRGYTIAKKNSSETDFSKRALRAIKNGDFIPIIGDTIRNEYIFDPNADATVGIRHRVQSRLQTDSLQIDLDKMNITEKLAYFWVTEINCEAQEAQKAAKAAKKKAAQANSKTETGAELIKIAEETKKNARKKAKLQYPLADGYKMAQVAQYLSLFKNSKAVNQDYLDFLKRVLLEDMYALAERDEDEEEQAYLGHLRYGNETYDDVSSDYLFSQMVADLDLPRQDDPVHMLATLNQKLYITTSYYNFLERELEALGKQPRTRVCQWKNFTLREDYVETYDEPTVESTIVFHLFGIEDHPESMVLSEDDYLDFLWALAWNAKSKMDNGESIIPGYISERVNSLSHPLLLLGFRLHDWELRVVLRGVLRERIGKDREQVGASVALQIDADRQPFVRDAQQAKKYLEKYYGRACLDVEFQNAMQFVKELTDKYYQRHEGNNQ